jgi:hypothetical protein
MQPAPKKLLDQVRDAIHRLPTDPYLALRPQLLGNARATPSALRGLIGSDHVLLYP